MRLAGLQYFKQGSDTVDRAPGQRGAMRQRIGVLWVRLDELQQSVDELYRLLERLESGLPTRQTRDTSRLAQHPSPERSRFDSDYWLG